MAEFIDLFELTKDMDCKFNFTLPEASKWIESDVYCFLYGRAALNQSSPRCTQDWRETKTLKHGRNTIKKRLKRQDAVKPVKTRQDWRTSRNYQPGYRTLAEKGIKDWRKTKVKLPGEKEKSVLMPYGYRGADFKPVVGFNPVYAARKQAYCYYFAGEFYCFGWARARNFIDVTDVLMGRCDWPIDLRSIMYDFNLDLSYLGAYPFLAYCVRKHIRILKYQHYVDYLSKGFAL